MGNVSNNDSEDMAVLHAVVVILPIALAAAGAWFARTSAAVANWMIQHKIIVPTDQAVLKLGDYGGLDTIRIIGAVAVFILILCFPIMLRRRS